MKVVAITGSPHPNGNSNYLTDIVLEEISIAGIETKKYDLGQCNIGYCKAHANCAELDACIQKDDAPGIIEDFSNADAVVVASPVHVSNVSAQMKTFMDRNFFMVSHNLDYKFRYAAVIAAAGGKGAEETVAILKQFTKLPEDKVLATTCYMRGEKNIRNKTEEIENARQIGKRLVSLLNDKSAD